MATSTRRPYAPRKPVEERREQLLDAALQIIVRDGYQALSIEAIAREVGVTRPVIYNIFPNLNALLRALFARQEQRSLEQIAQVLPTDPGSRTPDEIVLDAVTGSLQMMVDDPDNWKLVLLPPAGTPPEMREHVEENRQRLLEQLSRLIEWGLKELGREGQVDVDLLARTLLVAGEEAGRMMLAEPDKYTPERLGAYAVGLFNVVRGTPGT